MTCIDLRELAGKRYRLGHDHKPDVRATDDPALLTIPCEFGHLYPHGGSLIGFATNGRGPTAKRLAALPYVTIQQEGSDGLNLTFEAEHFAAVAKIVRPKRRRVLTEAQKAVCRDRLAKFAFPTAVQGDSVERRCVRTGQDDLRPVQAAERF